ncbi:MAG: hypothetical protein AAFR87_03385, partial [Bacteroidota bacterium]
QVIDWLLAHLDGQKRDVRRQITIQSNRFQKLKRRRLEGSIDRNSANVESSQISGILLEILDNYDFEEGNPDKADAKINGSSLDSPPKKSPRLASVGMLLLGITLVSASGVLLWNLLGKKPTTEGKEKVEVNYTAANWLGFWEVNFINAGKDRKANLVLKAEGAKWLGTVSILAEGRDAAYDLILDNMQPAENYLWLSGRWRTEPDFIPAMNGEFSLSLKENGKAFEGYFRNRDGSGKQNSWKGKKK